jgi:hypothetical protein
VRSLWRRKCRLLARFYRQNPFVACRLSGDERTKRGRGEIDVFDPLPTWVHPEANCSFNRLAGRAYWRRPSPDHSGGSARGSAIQLRVSMPRALGESAPAVLGVPHGPVIS